MGARLPTRMRLSTTAFSCCFTQNSAHDVVSQPRSSCTSTYAQRHGGLVVRTCARDNIASVTVGTHDNCSLRCLQCLCPVTGSNSLRVHSADVGEDRLAID